MPTPHHNQPAQDIASSSLARVIEQATARSGELVSGGAASSVAHSENVIDIDPASGLVAYVVTVTVVKHVEGIPAKPAPAPGPRPTRPTPAPRPAEPRPGRVMLPSEALFHFARQRNWGVRPHDGKVNPQIIFAAIAAQGFTEKVITADNLEAAKAALERHFNPT